MSNFNEYIEEGYNPLVDRFYELVGRIDYASLNLLNPKAFELIMDISDAIGRSDGGIFHDAKELEKDVNRLKELLGGK